MHFVIRLYSVIVGVVLVLALGTGGATASRGTELSVASGELGRVRADGRLTFAGREFGRVICEWHLTVSYNRTIAKRAGATIGRVDGVTVNFCSGGDVFVLPRMFSWPVTYVSFAGTLPTITSLRLEIRLAKFLIEAFGGLSECLYNGSAQATTSGSPISSFRLDERFAMPLESELLGSFPCPLAGAFAGSLTVSPQLRMRLI